MHQSIIKISLFLAALIGTTACGTKKLADQDVVKLPKIKEEVLIQRLDSISKQRPEYFYTKLSTRYADKETEISFTASTRIRKDSATQVTITYARIPIYNAMVTPDSLTLVDRRSKCYTQAGMEFLKKSFDVDFSLKNIEELLLGLPIGWDINKEYHQIRDPYNYIISHQNNRTIRRLETVEDEVVVQYYMNNEANSIEKLVIDSPKDTASITVDYGERILIDGFNIPQKVKVNIKTARNEIFVDLKYTKIEINEPRILYLAIPDKYEACE